MMDRDLVIASEVAAQLSGIFGVDSRQCGRRVAAARAITSEPG
jgi:hypothetical protein